MMSSTLLMLLAVLGPAASHYAEVLQQNFNNIKNYRSRDAIATLSMEQAFGFTDPKMANWSNLVPSMKLTNWSQLLPSERIISKACGSDLLYFIENNSSSQWAIRMLDATGRPGAGFLAGNLKWLGSYDECMATRSPKFRAKYCGAVIKYKVPNYPAPVQLNWGTCFPESCTAQDVQITLNSLISMATGSSPVSSVETHEHERPLDAPAKLAVSVLGVLLFVVALGTLYDLVRRCIQAMNERKLPERGDVNADLSHSHERNSSGEQLLSNRAEEYTPLLAGTTPQPPVLSRILISFSLITNGEKLLDTRVAAGTFTSLHGIRFLSMSWVILGHSMAFSLGYIENSSVIAEYFKRWTMQPILNGTFSVDSFFLLSGLLVTYLFLREHERNGRVNWFLFYFHRFWRLTPVYMLVLMTDACLGGYVSNGPLYPTQGFEIDRCSKDWWHNLLYINNLINNSTCFGWAWYLANDMQFHVISPLVLIPLTRWPLIGAAVMFGFLLIHIISVAVLTHTHHFGIGVLLGGGTGVESYMNLIYMKPYSRIGVFVIGMATGYLLHRTKCRLRIKPVWVVVGWLLATVVALADVYGLTHIYSGKTKLTEAMSISYNSLSRPAWALCLSWVIIMCCTGNGGFVNRLLSWRGFVPLSRLTYCAYLIHPMLMFIYNSSSRVPFYFNDLSQTYLFLANIFGAYLVAAVVSLCFEVPFMQLEKIFIKR